jgi:hypothetical protein
MKKNSNVTDLLKEFIGSASVNTLLRLRNSRKRCFLCSAAINTSSCHVLTKRYQVTNHNNESSPTISLFELQIANLS